MNLKYTPQGALIYVTLLALAVAAALFLRRRKSAAGAAYFAAFVTAVASMVYRGWHTGHAPMQNQFEIFLLMGALLWPLSRASRRLTGVETDLQDTLLGVLLLIPAGFVFSEEVRRLPPALQSPLFVPHVASYLAGYVMLARAALIALPLFRAPSAARAHQIRLHESAAFLTVTVGFLLLTTGLILGAVWGKIAWGDYWQWDPKEMWSLATWLVYCAYFHFRTRGMAPDRFRIIAILLWTGLLFVILTVTWVNLSRVFQGMHNYAS